jgi:hypothetical protein
MLRPSESPGLDRRELEHLLTRVQDGVVSRRQLVELGARPHEIRRMLRRGELVVVHPGVYVSHNGPLTGAQREWAAVLAHWPAALARRSALSRPASDGPVHVVVDRKRTVVPVKGVVAHRASHLDDRVWWQRCPPVMKLEHAAVDVAVTEPDLAARFTVFADAVQTRETTAQAIADALRQRRGVPDQRLLLELLDDLAAGACSVLEREYLRLADRHGLPNTEAEGVSRQAPAAGRPAYRDVLYEQFDVVVELDGRAFHDNADARDRDAARDLDTLVREDRITVRLTYGQVLRDGCSTIDQIASLLRRRGWTGPVGRCPRCPGE